MKLAVNPAAVGFDAYGPPFDVSADVAGGAQAGL